MRTVVHASCQSLISQLATLDIGFYRRIGGAGNTAAGTDSRNCRAPCETTVARRNKNATLSGPIRWNMAGMLVGTLSGGSRSLAPTTWGCHPVRNLGISLAKLSPGALAPFDAHGRPPAAAAATHVCYMIPQTLGSSYEHKRHSLWHQTCTILGAKRS